MQLPPLADLLRPLPLIRRGHAPWHIRGWQTSWGWTCLMALFLTAASFSQLHAAPDISAPNNVSFGSAPIPGGTTTYTIAVQNTGNMPLMIAGVTIVGTDAASFTITQALASTIAAGSTATMEVKFAPVKVWQSSANLRITSNDPDESPFNINIYGVGYGPEISVSAAKTLTDGDDTPSLTDGTDFGSQPAATSRTQSFLIQDAGPERLTLGDVTLSGDAAFSISQQPGPFGNGFSTFTITFTPGFPGLHSATVSIANNDYDENPFNFSIQGTGVNGAPTDLTLSKSSIAEGNYPGAPVGVLTTTDPDAGQVHTLSLVAGDGDADNSAFTFSETYLVINNRADYESKSSYSIRVRTTDNSTPPLSFEKAFTITVTDMNEAALAIAQQAFFKASNPGENDWFGYRVAVSGDTVVVGARYEDSASTGVNSTPDDNATNAGAAYIFMRDAGGNWTQQAYLKASNPGGDDQFGSTVAVSGDTVVVGAPNEDSSTTSLNSTPDDAAPNAGAAYVFTRQNGVWTQQAYLKAGNAAAGDFFGTAVAISGDTLLVGAPGEDSSSAGVNGMPDEGASASGAAYVFTRDTGKWTQEAFLKTDHPDAGDTTGTAVAIDGDVAVIGAPLEDSSSTGVNSVPDRNTARSGAAFVFARNAGVWSQQAYLKAHTTRIGDNFGSCVGVSGNTVVVGAPSEDGSGTGVNSTPDINAAGAGAAYIFNRAGNTWSQQAYLKAHNTREIDTFGRSVTVSGDIVVVGANLEDSSTSGVNSTPDVLADQAGAAYVFQRSGSIWSQQAYLKAHNTGEVDQFGIDVALSGTTLLSGATHEDSSTSGVNASINELGSDTGAVYVYSLPQPADIVVRGGDVDITDGDTSASLTDHTHFGSVSAASGSVTRTFVLQNMGAVSLILDSLTFTGAHASDFTVAQSPAAILSGGESTEMKVTFNPGSTGTRQAVLSISSNDSDESPFDFSLQGTGVDPGVTVTGLSGITNNDISPSLANGTDFGKILAGQEGMERLFTIRNPGSATLELNDLGISGPQAAHFTITQAPAGSVAPGSSTTFKIRFFAAPGVQRATVSFTTNVFDEQAFSFVIWGQGVVGQPAVQKVTFNPPATLFISQSPLVLSATASSGLPVTFALVSGPATLEGSVLTLTGPGFVKVTATQAGNGSFKAAPAVTKTIQVKAAPTTPTLVDLSQTYDGSAREVTVIGATGAPVITYLVDKISTSTPPVNAGKYPVKAVVDGKTLVGSLVIAQAPLQVAPDSQRRFIGQANPALTVTYAGFVGPDTESSAFALSGARRPELKTTAKASSSGGLYAITASGAVLRNYTPVYVSGTLLVETFAGMYEAMLEDESGHLAGKVEFTVAASSTTLSGRLTVPGEAAPISFTGTLSVDPANEKATGASKPVTKSGRTYALTFELPFGADFESELHINSTLTAQTTEGMKVWAPAKSQQNLFTGAHTLILAPALPAGPEVPAGYGHGTAVIDSKATLKIVGRLGDGTTLTATLVPDIQLGYRLFALPYGRSGSYIAGWLDFEAHPLLTTRVHVPPSAGCDLVWAKDGQTKDKSYRDDFGPVLTRVTVDPWIVPTKTTTLTSLLGLSPSTPFDVAHSGIESAAFSNLPAEATLTATNKLLVTQTTNSTRWSATVTPATGAFAGSFELLDAGKKRVVPFTGVLRQPHGTTSGPLGAGHALVPALPSDLTHGTISGAIRFDTSDD